MPFSVILSIYYKESPLFLRESLDSLFSQTICPDEVILVKDGPIGDELDNVIDSYVTRYPYLKVLSLVTNRGLGKALNEGLKYCSHELVARMDTDDIAMPERFENSWLYLRNIRILMLLVRGLVSLKIMYPI